MSSTPFRSDYHDARYADPDAVSQPDYEWAVERDVTIVVRDGCRLSADIFRPKTEKPVPALLAVSPYGKDKQSMGLPPQPHNSLVFDHGLEAGDYEFFTSRGYTYVILDPRGCGSSDGEWFGFYSRQEQEDTYDVIEWIAVQPWCDGNVGMTGHSYFGIMQLLTAELQPPALKAIAPMEFFVDLYEKAFPGGITSSVYWFVSSMVANHTTVFNSERMYSPDDLKALLESRRRDPDIAANPYFVHELSAPHKNAAYMDMLLHQTQGDFWDERSARNRLENINIPVHSFGFWTYGFLLDGVFDVFSDTRVTTSKRASVLTYGTSSAKLPLRVYNEELLRWYDHWLKGLDTGITDEPPVKILVLGEERYRYENEWPLARTNWKKLYLRPFGELDFNSVVDDDLPPDSFVHRPPHVSMKFDSLEYETAPFKQDMEVTGPLNLTLSASIDQPDANFIVHVYDVDPSGGMRFLSKGYLKASHRELHEDSTEWHTRHSHHNPTGVPLNEIIEYKIYLSVISNVFKKGHRLLLIIGSLEAEAAGSSNTIDLSNIGTKMAQLGALPSSKTTCYRIYRDGTHESYLYLPVVPLTPSNHDRWVQPLCD